MQGVLFDMLIRQCGQRPFKIWREINIPRATRLTRVIQLTPDRAVVFVTHSKESC